jgi:hypothetical protein
VRIAGDAVDMPTMQGIIIGLVTASLGVGSVGYAYYIKQVDYAHVDGSITDVRNICYRLPKNSKVKIRDTSVFLPKDEHPCPEIRFGFNKDKDTQRRIARFTLIDVRYISPVDGQRHNTTIRKLSNISHSQLKIGQAIEMRAHKRNADEALVDHLPDGVTG